ncbi:MAG: Gfo/Idh/MocA family oxidoreductase [Acidimicrobiia bacterium]|nr:Gfo/Idh/MocA family oxidoreductase [Acidimicrobiia bacterium]MDH3470932.1 Gfo/Idh/MocA family oxidoreductase [Acidimicrobiia bacterium]
MTEATRLASVGLGWWGSNLADAATKEGAEVVAAFARTPSSREAFAAKHPCRTPDTLEEIWNDPEIDGVLLATPHTTHGDYIVAAAESGKHVFVEKPFTLTVAEGKRAIAAAERAGVVLQVGHNKRRQPANRRLKQLIDDGALGQVMMVETQQSVPNAQKFQPDYWRADRNESPLGGMTSLGVHMIDTMHYLLGPVLRVFAFSNVLMDSPPIDDATAIVLEFPSGQLGYLGTSFVVPRATDIAVRGTEGSAWNEENGTRFFRQARDDEARSEEPIDTLDTIADQLGEFLAAIRGESVPETGGAEALEVIAVLEAAQASSESGRAESVADFR